MTHGVPANHLHRRQAFCFSDFRFRQDRRNGVVAVRSEREATRVQHRFARGIDCQGHVIGEVQDRNRETCFHHRACGSRHRGTCSREGGSTTQDTFGHINHSFGINQRLHEAHSPHANLLKGMVRTCCTFIRRQEVGGDIQGRTLAHRQDHRIVCRSSLTPRHQACGCTTSNFCSDTGGQRIVGVRIDRVTFGIHGGVRCRIGAVALVSDTSDFEGGATRNIHVLRREQRCTRTREAEAMREDLLTCIRC